MSSATAVSYPVSPSSDPRDVSNWVFQMTGDQLKAWRARMGYTEEQAARAFNRPVETYRGWEARPIVDSMVASLTQLFDRQMGLD